MVAVSLVDVLVAATSFVIGLAAVAAAVGVLARSPVFGRPIKWLWRRNVSVPLADWNRQIIRGVVDERIEYLMHNNNDGSSLLDLSEKLDTVEQRSRSNSEAIRRVDTKVSRLLAHDAQRDTPGKRYSHPNPDNQSEEVHVEDA